MRYVFLLILLAGVVMVGLNPFGFELVWIDPCWDQRYTRHAYIPEGC